MRWLRVALVAAGLLTAGRGAVGLVGSTGGDALRSVVAWFLGSVVLHDAVAVPAVLAVGLATRAVPAVARRYVQAGLVVSGTVALVAAPLVSGLGRTPGNPSALPGNYAHGLLGVLAAVWAGVAVTAFAGAAVARSRVGRSRRRAGSARGTDDP